MAGSLEDYKNLLAKAEKIITTHKYEWQKSGKYFNVFSTLGVEWKEVYHTAFLKELLAPNGQHGLGDNFLKEFLKRIDFNKSPLENIIVKKEENIGKNGRLDISISFICNDKRYKVVIENKIREVDHEGQLRKYLNYLRTENFDDYRLVYLTLNGDDPIDEICDEDKKYFLTMSYRSDIISLLEKVINIGNMPPYAIEAAIRQYILSLKILTNQGVDKNMEEEIENLLLEGNNIEFVQELNGRIVPLKKKVLFQFISLLKSEFEKNGRSVSITYNNKKMEIEATVTNYITKSESWLQFTFPVKDFVFYVTFNPEGWHWEEVKKDNDEKKSKEKTEEFRQTRGTEFKNFVINFKQFDDGAKQFASMPEDEQRKYISDYVEDIKSKLKKLDF